MKWLEPRRDLRKKNSAIKSGDLVQIVPWCIHKGRLGHVVAVQPWSNGELTVQLLDEEGLGMDPISVSRGNCVLLTKMAIAPEVISESR